MSEVISRAGYVLRWSPLRSRTRAKSPDTQAAQIGGVGWAMLALATFLLVVFVVVTVEEIFLIGECGVGPAADTSCTWSERL